MIADIADVTARLGSSEGSGFVTHGLYGNPAPIEDSVSKYYLRVEVEDRPGVLAQIAAVLGELDVGILSLIQPEDHDEETAPIVLMLHYAPFGVVQEALERISKLDCVCESPVLLRVEDLG